MEAMVIVDVASSYPHTLHLPPLCYSRIACISDNLFLASCLHLPTSHQTRRRRSNATYLLQGKKKQSTGLKQWIKRQRSSCLGNHTSLALLALDHNHFASMYPREQAFGVSSDFIIMSNLRNLPGTPSDSSSFDSWSERLTIAEGQVSGTWTLAQSMPQSSKRESESKIVKTAWEKLLRWSRSWQLLQARSQHNQLEKVNKVVVLGGGSFGTAMAVLLARKKAEMEVQLVVRDASVCETINQRHSNMKYFPHHTLPKNVVATLDAEEALAGAQFCIHAIPVQASAAFLQKISKHVSSTLPFLSVSKGLELSTLEIMSQVIPKALGNPRQPLAVLSGPSFSIELMDQLPTAVVVASKDKELARATQQLLASRYLRVNTSSDVIGVEIAGALKNVLAIAAGIVEGMNLGNNCMAALVAQGCSEIRWLAEKMGAESSTLAGLSGTGDIMLTCFVKLSRNRSVGVRLGAGETLESIQSSMNQVAEGVATAGAVIALARKYRVQMPVLTAVARILDNELTPKKAVLELMSLPHVEEV
ncbi:hypothetical protein O6H91_16G036700 [Diphasiastrum complanatum]|uniref:Uncharacterized protein n=2 Tax=Diphasiastrum complanatum TaxID=34168 RepID=A0ACC2BBB5_DIPCM|nr:hypothetical protein O6H91_16G036700 [Diphasiastrum complanatum]KAJ7527098.1 hypothetical protein O6H91_16G036700 [Diphasiastrum complanatum]